MRRLLPLVLAAAPIALPAATATEVLAAIDGGLPAEELADREQAVRAKAIAAALADAKLDLDAAGRKELRAALGEAWLDAGRLDEAERELVAVAADAAADPAVRERAGLAWVAARQRRSETSPAGKEPPPIVESIAVLGDPCPPRVRARALTADAQRLLAAARPAPGSTAPVVAPAVLAGFDEALALLAGLEPDERVPVYTLRLLAMEAAGAKPEEVMAWLRARQADPAAALVAESALTGNQQMVGRTAPALKGRRLDAAGGEFDLATLRGRPVLIEFFATWCKPCVALAPAVAGLADRLGRRGLQTVGVSLDTKDSLPQLPAWIAQHGIAYPILGDGLGWDTEIDDIWHVDAIPALILVGPDGTVLATDLVGSTVEETVQAVEKAVAPLLGKPAAVVP